MPRAPRGKRVIDEASGTYTVAGRAANGEPDPYFDKTRKVWVAPWRKPDGRTGRPTGKTRAAAVTSRDRHIAKAKEDERFTPLAEGFTSESTVADLIDWWLTNVGRHRVRTTTFTTYAKQLSVAADAFGDTSCCSGSPEPAAAYVTNLAIYCDKTLGG